MVTWLDRTVYPFESHYLTLPDGRMHYVDEGEEDVILMVHGTPTWSFLYRHLVSGLSADYRTIAPDHLGSGLSDKPADFGYRPADHAKNLHTLITELDLKNITLVVHDFGGPIGLSYALEHPENVSRLVLFNTWMWSLHGDLSKAIVGRVIGSPVGRFLYRHMNFEFNVIVPAAYGDRSRLTPTILKHYKGPFEDPMSTQIAWIYARELLGSTEWYDTLWAKRNILRDIPTLLLWGTKDPVFGKPYLDRWQQVFDRATVVTFPDTGHFVQDEQGATLIPIITEFLQTQ